MRLSKTLKICLAALLVIGLGLLGYAVISHDILAKIISLVDENTPAYLFIILMILLPTFGFPLSPFLLVLGIKFGLAGGIALMVLIMPIHMLISFALTKIADDFIRTLLSRGSYVIPKVPADKQIRFTFLIASIPVLPYPIKNFLLPLAGISFPVYMSMNWGCQAVMAIPAVVLGSSVADLNPVMFIAAVAGLVAVYLVISWIEKKYGKQVALKAEENRKITTD
jgi:uncharacterized membrane protein YdjX (TVP38/TMEM64 family)